ncbi:Rpn family recombination-promoting nuclease/putative transposase [Sediminibacterium ginsengisoli]|uniref:PD-(D/E)XK nuclease family transposase n=1 Tax=Sediminibacterium ginsengisoli TaxID=413434 RepID=A0A1T4PJ32_9BACT|nr:Rpn family recombination-promoting nuclease/putative transposase [Sediminibacterium ginsengisoli]SJZ91553.1 conserved hypothetical protein (putative transposase or invertase) [Sediminibacterium ginsengisoli]
MRGYSDAGIYVDPFTDFSFKKLFGPEQNQDLLTDFLNAILKKSVRSVIHLNTERMGRTRTGRKVIFDLFCETDQGEKVIIELQNASQSKFADRSLFYATMAIQEQEKKGKWNFGLSPVYMINILNFSFPLSPGQNAVHEISLRDDHSCRLFTNCLHLIYIEIPKFTKQESELANRGDEWLFLLKHMSTFQDIPKAFSGNAVYRKLFFTARLGSLNKEEMTIYQVKLKEKRDRENQLEFAEQIGIEKGKNDMCNEIINRMKSKGYSCNEIAGITGISIEYLQ